MAEVIVMPTLGQSMEEGTILQWFKREGDSVRKGEPLLEVMSDKANFEVEAEAEGVLRKIVAQVNDTVPVNQPIAIIGRADEVIDSVDQGGASEEGKATQKTVEAAARPTAQAPDVPVAGERTPVSPRARRLADEHGIAAAELAGIGSGPGGRVLERDVMAFLERRPPDDGGRARMTPLAAKLADDFGIDLGDLSLGLPGSRVTADVVKRRAESVSPLSGEEPSISERIPLHGLRKLIAENVTRSRQTAPHVTLNMEVDMTAVVAMWPELQAEVQKAHSVKVTYTDLLIKASAAALTDHPLCNAALIGEEIVVYGQRNIGVAVAAETGLLVPVVRNPESKSLAEVSLELKGLVARCRQGKQTSEDISGGTFTITNLGAFGVDTFDPIIVPPQSCILGVGRITEKVSAVKGQAVVRSMMNLCLSFDHRVLDGVPAARFLQRLKALLETPMLVFV